MADANENKEQEKESVRTDKNTFERIELIW